MTIRSLLWRAGTFLVAAALTPPSLGSPLAQRYDDDDNDGPSRVARLSYVEGDVSVLASNESEWESIDANAPLFEGAEIYADRDARAEIALGGNSFLRLTDGADVTITHLEDGWAIVDVTSGTVALSIGRQGRDDHYSVSAPAAAVSPHEAGDYRVDVADNGDTWVTVSRGSAEIATTEGSFDALEGDLVSLSYDEPDDVDLVGDAARWNRDEFDRWDAERDDYYTRLDERDLPRPVRALVGRDDIYGLAELSLFGSWLALGNGQFGWQPREARNSDWSPYQDGYWDYSSRNGWTWISNESWGWAPYHYGRWNFDDRNGWAWVPTHGDSQTLASAPSGRYYWKPALVYMWRPRGEDAYAWVPLAPGERYVPFSASTATSSRPTSRRTALDPTFRPRYFRERRGVVAIAPDALMTRKRPQRFARGSVDRTEAPTADAPVLRAELPRPSRRPANVAPARVRPSDAIRRRAVVVDPTMASGATRAGNPARQDQSAERPTRQARQAERRKLRLERKTAVEAGVAQPSQQPSATSGSGAAPARPGRRGGRKLNRTADGENGTPAASDTTGSPTRTRARREPPAQTTEPDAAEPTTAEPSTTTPAPADRQPAGRGRRGRTDESAPPARTTAPSKADAPATETASPNADEPAPESPDAKRRAERRRLRQQKRAQDQQVPEEKDDETTAPADDAPRPDDEP